MSDWKQGTIGELARGVRGVSYRPEHLLPPFRPDGAVLLRSTNIQDGTISLEDVQIVPSFLVSDDQRVNRNDIVVCMSNGSKALVGKSAPCKTQANDILTIGAFCSVFHPKPTAEASFVAHVFQGEGFRKNIDVTLAGSAINNLRNTDVERFHCLIPQRDEQSRIAAVLDTIDEAIAKTEAVIEKLRQLRAGFLHDLLTRGLDENGQLRDPIAHPEQFQDSQLGCIPREWEVIRIGSETDIEHGFAFDGRLFADKPLGPRLLIPGNFDRDVGLYFTDENTKYFAGEFPPETVLANGDVLIVMTDLSPRTLILGRTVLLNEPFPVLHNQRIGKFRFKQETDWNPEFFVALMNDERVRRKVIRESTGTTVRHTSPDRIKSGLGVKPRRGEQNQIVSTFRACVSEIAAAGSELVKLTALKSGLMTDLLTGCLRVPVEITGA